MRQIVGGRADWQLAASTSEMSRFETQMLTKPENLTALTDMSGQWIDQVNSRVGMKKLILDMDSSESPTYGKQEGSAFNGHFGCTCYHPLFCFNQFGDLERANLRKGNVHSADDWLSVLQPVVARYRERPLKRLFRGDAAFAKPDLYSYLEEESFSYAIRLKSNAILQKHIAPLLTRPVGRPSWAPKVVLCELSVSSRQLAESSPGAGQGRVARRRVICASRLHPDKSELATQERSEILQPLGHRRAVDQRGQTCHPLDPIVLP